MALDGAFLACLRRELTEALPDARVDKIHQPSKEELVLLFRFRGGSERVYMSARANSPRVHLTHIVPENPAAPPMFCMLLRKRLTGGHLIGIRQNGWERALYFDFDCVNELGDIVRLTLAVEIMGRHSNIILIDENGVVVDAIKHVDSEMSSVRPVLPGLRYELPPCAADGCDLSLCEPTLPAELVRRGPSLPLAKALLTCVHGLSPLVCREVAYQTLRGKDKRSDELTEDEMQRLTFYLKRVKETVETGQRLVPYTLRDLKGAPLEYSFMLITQYGLTAVGREMPTFSAVLDEFYEEKDATERRRQRAQDILRVLTNATDRTARKLELQRQELARSVNRDEYRVQADLINANIGQIPKGTASAELVNYYDPECRTATVHLDPALSAAQNAQKYYKLYRKAQTAERVLAEQIAAGEEELQYLDSVFDALSRAVTFRELGELREELAAQGYLKLPRGRQKMPAAQGPLRFCSDDGFVILVGRNNVQNDQLTLKTARGSDWWFHVKAAAGSHVIVVSDGQQPPDRTLSQAAILAATHSKAADSAQVAVDYTQAKNVKKPTGAKPGRVIYVEYQTAFVTPDKALAQRLAAKEDGKGE